jgi:ubiquinone biosynthesis protein Coq4
MHLNYQMPIVVISNQPLEAGEGVVVMSMEAYLSKHWPGLTELHDMYHSISAALQAITEEPDLTGRFHCMLCDV